nr:MAG TPA: hypothetical protein [Caudoviricetes sp.]
MKSSIFLIPVERESTFFKTLSSLGLTTSIPRFTS